MFLADVGRLLGTSFKIYSLYLLEYWLSRVEFSSKSILDSSIKY